MINLKHASFPDLADRIMARYSAKEDALLLDVLGQEYTVRHEGVFLRGQKAPEIHAAVIIDYLSSSGSDAVALPWRSFGDFSTLPVPNFRKKVELPLAGLAEEIVGRAGTILPMIDAAADPTIVGGDVAITVRALTKVHLHMELFQETEDFPAEAWVLFSNNADAFLSLPSLQSLAEMFKDRLLSLLRIY